MSLEFFIYFVLPSALVIGFILIERDANRRRRDVIRQLLTGFVSAERIVTLSSNKLKVQFTGTSFIFHLARLKSTGADSVGIFIARPTAQPYLLPGPAVKGKKDAMRESRNTGVQSIQEPGTRALATRMSRDPRMRALSTTHGSEVALIQLSPSRSLPPFTHLGARLDQPGRGSSQGGHGVWDSKVFEDTLLLLIGLSRELP